ncbi:hypothetical protein B0H63DRAFT_548807 [Podospora didyma]|uniref:Uncharacterized protein n=1 Tax=Podospora didyma TaxID=330526 RepID=A0AAE0KDK8_9PEZI|nr:hypothetical protein B0H63DRAFT_548807 [Podospora didyma]
MLYTTLPATEVDSILTLDLRDSNNKDKRLRSKTIKSLSCPLTQGNATLPLPLLLHRSGQFVPPSLVRGEDSNNNNNNNNNNYNNYNNNHWPPLYHNGYQDDTILGCNMSCQAMLRVANIKIAWVDSFPLHLEFDELTATLKPFRFPSLRAMLAMPRNSQSTIFDQQVLVL